MNAIYVILTLVFAAVMLLAIMVLFGVLAVYLFEVEEEEINQ